MPLVELCLQGAVKPQAPRRAKSGWPNVKKFNLLAFFNCLIINYFDKIDWTIRHSPTDN